jgi:hypothetical protein
MAIWRSDSIWPDLAAFLMLLLMGHLLLGHFEDYKPKWRRVTKVLVSTAFFIGVWLLLGRLWTWVFFVGAVSLGLLIVHGWWLPKHGVNGWTGEPREKYLELVRRRSKPRDVQ